jgi:hypothetical protein
MPAPSGAIVLESHVVSQYLTDANHSQRIAVTNAQQTLEAVLIETFSRLSVENNKLANKKKQENLDFDNAVTIACEIAKIKLLVHLTKMIAQMVQAFHEDKEKSIKEHLQRFTKILDYSTNPVPLVLPTKHDSPESYTEKILTQAKIALEAIAVQQEQIKTHMLDTWGATTWEEGWKIQVDNIHEQMAESIDNLEFLEIIEKPDGSSIDPDDLDPEVSQNAREEMHHVNDEFQDFLEEYVPSSPYIDTTHDLPNYENPEAPAAPAIEETIIPAPVMTFSRPTQMTRDAELKLIHDTRQAMTKIGKPLIEENNVEVDKHKVNKNSALRLAVRYTDSVSGNIKTLEDKMNAFAKDSHMLKNLQNLATSIEEKVNQVNQGLHHRPASPSSR